MQPNYSQILLGMLLRTFRRLKHDKSTAEVLMGPSNSIFQLKHIQAHIFKDSDKN